MLLKRGNHFNAFVTHQFETDPNFNLKEVRLLFYKQNKKILKTCKFCCNFFVSLTMTRILRRITSSEIAQSARAGVL